MAALWAIEDYYESIPVADVVLEKLMPFYDFVRDAMRCRQLMESEWYQEQFKPDWKMCDDQNLKQYYRNTASGERVAISVGGGVTGYRGNGVIIDDPLNAMDAYSDTIRNGANRWLAEAASSRLNDPRNGFIRDHHAALARG
jgi:hypothetical protein